MAEPRQHVARLLVFRAWPAVRARRSPLTAVRVGLQAASEPRVRMVGVSSAPAKCFMEEAKMLSQYVAVSLLMPRVRGSALSNFPLYNSALNYFRGCSGCACPATRTRARFVLEALRLALFLTPAPFSAAVPCIIAFSS